MGDIGTCNVPVLILPDVFGLDPESVTFWAAPDDIAGGGLGGGGGPLGGALIAIIRSQISNNERSVEHSMTRSAINDVNSVKEIHEDFITVE